MDFLLNLGASLGVHHRHGDFLILTAAEVEASFQGDAVLRRRHGYVLRLGHAVLDLPLRNKCTDGGGALCPLDGPSEVVAASEYQTQGAGEEECADVQEVEALAGLVAREFLVEIADCQAQISATKVSLTFGTRHEGRNSPAPQRQVSGEIHRSFANTFRRRVREELLEAELRQVVADLIAGYGTGKSCIDVA